MSLLETATNGLVIAGVVILVSVILTSWLASYRTPKATPVSSGDWFFGLPTWAQIIGGLATFVLLAYAGYLLWSPLPLTLSSDAGTVLRVTGLVFFFIGWGLVLWARWTLGTMYGVSTSFAAPLQAGHRLIQHGPYALVRHPMYLGYWLVFAGALLIYHTWTPLLLLILCVPSFYLRAQREEVALAATFGAEWQAYTTRTKFLIPFVY